MLFDVNIQSAEMISNSESLNLEVTIPARARSITHERILS